MQVFHHFVLTAEIEPTIMRSRVRRLNHSATPPLPYLQYFLPEHARVSGVGQHHVEQLSHVRLEHEQEDLVFLGRLQQRAEQVEHLTNLQETHEHSLDVIAS